MKTQKKTSNDDYYVIWLGICACLLLALMFWLQGCNTMYGVGTDLRQMSENYVEGHNDDK